MIQTKKINLDNNRKEIVEKSTVVKIVSLRKEYRLLVTIKILIVNRIVIHTGTAKETQQIALYLRRKFEGRIFAKCASQHFKKLKKTSILATVSTKYVSSAIKGRLMKKKESVQTVLSIMIRLELRNTNKVELIGQIKLQLHPQILSIIDLSKQMLSN